MGEVIEYELTTGLHPAAARCAVWCHIEPNHNGTDKTWCFYNLRFYDVDDNYLWTTDLGGLFEPWMEIPGPPECVLEGRSLGVDELDQFDKYFSY